MGNRHIIKRLRRVNVASIVYKRCCSGAVADFPVLRLNLTFTTSYLILHMAN